MMKSKLLLLAAALATILLLPLTSSGQQAGTILIDGLQVGTLQYVPHGEGYGWEEWWWLYENHASVGTATVDEGFYVFESPEGNGDTLIRYIGHLINNGTITEATVNRSGVIYNNNMIDNATINDGGSLYNNGTITDAIVNSTGSLYNYGGTVETATFNYGRLENHGTVKTATVTGGFHSNFGTISNAMVNGGRLNNAWGTIADAMVDGGTLGNYGIINNATVDGGRLDNGGSYMANDYNEYEFGYGMINSVTVNGGILQNDEAGTVINITQNGGTVHNGGRIETMTYVAGTYKGQAEYTGINVNADREWGHWTYIGSIGTLALAGNSALNTGDWGIIENLVFDSNGNGIASLTAIADGGSFGFNGINANYVDFAYGNISLDLSALGSFGDDWASAFFDAFGFDDGFYLASLFDATGFCGLENLNSLGVTFGTDSFWILNNGVLESGWRIDSVTGYVSWAEVPEPTTLLILGLGLAGLPIFRRFRKG